MPGGVRPVNAQVHTRERGRRTSPASRPAAAGEPLETGLPGRALKPTEHFGRGVARDVTLRVVPPFLECGQHILALDRPASLCPRFAALQVDTRHDGLDCLRVGVRALDAVHDSRVADRFQASTIVGSHDQSAATGGGRPRSDQAVSRRCRFLRNDSRGQLWESRFRGRCLAGRCVSRRRFPCRCVSRRRLSRTPVRRPVLWRWLRCRRGSWR